MAKDRRHRKLAWIVIATLVVSIIGVNFAAFGSNNTSGSVTIYLPIESNTYVAPLTVMGAEVIDAVNKAAGVDAMLQAGASWLRYNGLDWSLIEPTKGVYNWSYVDALKSQLAMYQGQPYNLILVVRDTPSWAQDTPGSVCGPIKPSEYGSFANFMKKLVSELSVPPYNVKYWEIGNEPDAPINDWNTLWGCWGGYTLPNYGGNAYGDMLRVVYPAIKSADPNAVVLVGGLLLDHPIDPKIGCPAEPGCFLLGVMARSYGAFDGVAYHGYDYYNYQNITVPGHYGNGGFGTNNTNGPVATAKEAYLRSLLVQGGYPGKLVFSTETSLVCSVGCDTTDFKNTKAAYVAIDYASAIVNQMPTRIWYDVFGSWKNNGLMTTLSQPLPAYNAFSFAATELGHASYSKTLIQPTLPVGVAGYEFTRSGRTIWLLWANDLGTHQVTLPRIPAFVYSTIGTALTPAQKVTLDFNPIYFEWYGSP